MLYFVWRLMWGVVLQVSVVKSSIKTVLNWAVIFKVKQQIKVPLTVHSHIILPTFLQDVFLMIRRHKTTIFTDAKESTTVYELKRIVEGILKRTPEDQRLYKVSLLMKSGHRSVEVKYMLKFISASLLTVENPTYPLEMSWYALKQIQTFWGH